MMSGMNGSWIRVALLLAGIFLSANPVVAQQRSRPPAPPIPDLNGLWDSDEEGMVTVVHAGRMIKVLTNRTCPGQTAPRPFYMQGKLSPPNNAGVMTISNGIMHRCENQHPVIQTCCGPRATWQTTFKAEVVGDWSISGSRVGEYWEADLDNNGNVIASSCKMTRTFEDPVILMRIGVSGLGAPVNPGQSPPASPGTTPGASPTATPDSHPFDRGLDWIEENWNEFTETVEDAMDDVYEGSGLQETLENDVGYQRYLDHSDHGHAEEGSDQ